MGFFKSKKEKQVADETPYVAAEVMEEGDLPVATPVGAFAVTPSQAPPQKKVEVIDAEVVPIKPQALKGEAAVRVTKVGGPTFGRKILSMDHCPACGVQSRTRIRTYPSLITWIAVVALLFLFWPIFWIPLVVDIMKTTDHFCIVCENKVGSVGPFEDCCVKKRS